MTILLKTNQGGMWVLPQIRELQRRGHLVTAVIPPGPGRLRAALDAAHVPVRVSPFDFSFRPSLTLARGLWRLRRLIKETRPDALFYHLYASALAARTSSMGLRVRRVHMVAGPLYLESPTIRLIERFLWHLDDHLIAGSEYTADRYRELGIPEHRLSTVPYGVDVDTYRQSTDERTQRLGCSPGTFVAIMVAYVYAPKSTVFPGIGIKGHDVLLGAWAEFCLRHPQSLLVLVGGGFDEAGEIHRQQLLREYDVAKSTNIQWLSSVDDVRPLYSSADVSVSPSLSENHGAALEASAMGLPSIVSDAGALPETVSRASGWIVPAGDRQALTAALEDAFMKFASRDLAAMGEAARELAEARFAVKDCATRVAEIVEA